MNINNRLLTNIALNECKSIENMAENAAKIAFYNFKWQFVTLVLFNTTLLCGVNAFLRSYKKNAIVANDAFVPKFSQRTRQIILFGTNMDDILYLLRWLEVKQFDSSAKHMIICQSNVGEDCDEGDVIEYLWERRIVNVIFINDVFNNGTAGYYYLYSDQCTSTPPIKVAHWDSCVSYNASEYCAGKFPVQFKNLHGCPMIVSTFDHPPFMYIKNGVPSGADGDLLKLIIYALNATLLIVRPSIGAGWGNLDDDGSWVGSLADLYYDLANISMTSATVTQSRYEAFEISSFYSSINIMWITHPSKTEPASHKLLHPFKIETRIALLFSFILIVVLALIFKTNFCLSLCKLINFGRLPADVIFSAWTLCMGQTVIVQPLNMTMVYLMLFWIWYCFLMRTFYQVHLINSLKTDIYLPEFSSIEDAIAAGYPFGGGPAFRDYYLEFPSVYDNWKDVESTELKTTMLNLTKGMKFVLAVSSATTKKFLKKPGRKLHILPKQIISSPTAIFFKKFSPLTRSFNRILKRLFEFGWPQKFFKDYTVSDIIDKSMEEDKPIKLRYCAGCYIILATGSALSFILFIIEIYIKRRSSSIISFTY